MINFSKNSKDLFAITLLDVNIYVNYMVFLDDNNTEFVGQERTIAYAYDTGGSKRAETYIEKLSESDIRKFASLFKRIAEIGSIPNKEKFKNLDGIIYEFNMTALIKLKSFVVVSR